MIYVCDFETTTDAVSVTESKIYLWGSISLKKRDQFKFGCNLASFFTWLEDPRFYCTRLYFHNLNFDGRFLIYYLVNQSDYTESNVNFERAIRFKNSKDWLKIKGRKLFNALMLHNQLYVIKLFLRTRVIKIVCSVKLLISSVAKIGKSLKIEKRKNINYDKYAYFETEQALLIKTAERRAKRNDDFFYFTKLEQLINHSKHKTKRICLEDKQCIICYMYYDLLIIKKAIVAIRKETKIKFRLTISSTAFAHFKKWFQTEKGFYLYFKYFGGKTPWESKVKNILSVHDWELVKKSYSGGFTAFKNNLVNHQIDGKIYAYDVNSLYPAVMQSEKLPYGRLLRTKPWGNDYVTLVKVVIKSAKMKQQFIDLNYPAFFRKKNEIVEVNKTNQNEHFIYEFYQDFKNNDFVFWQEEWLFLKQYYDFEFTNYTEYYFMTDDYFKDYIEQMKSFKENSTGAIRLFYKIFLNSIYGKFGQSYDIEFVQITDVKKLNDSVLNPQYQIDNQLSDYEYKIISKGYYDYKYNDNIFLKSNRQKAFLDRAHTVFFTKKKPEIKLDRFDKPVKKVLSYIPTASYITMKARMTLYKSICTNIKNFIYADTDSMYLTAVAKSIEIHQTKFGAWKDCGLFKRFKILRSKCYGMRSAVDNKDTFIVSNLRQIAAQKHLTWDNFKRGVIIRDDNLRSFKVYGGALLMPLEIKL